MRYRRALIVLLAVLMLIIPSSAQETGLSVRWNWNDGNVLPQSKEMSSVSITLSNEGKNQLRLKFVGLHFAWMPNDTYAYGGGSEKTNLLVPSQSITYTIPFAVPRDISVGQYKSYAAIVYQVSNGTAWTDISMVYYSPQSLEIVPLVVLTVTSTKTVGQPADWTVDLALLVTFTIVGLALLATIRSARRQGEATAQTPSTHYTGGEDKSNMY